MDKGYVQIYTGDGKGKTTAAVGLAVRAAGRGLRVLIVQFLKGASTGEADILYGLQNVTFRRVSDVKKFFWKMSEKEKTKMRENAVRMLNDVTNALRNDDVDVLMLDEALGALKNGIVTTEEIVQLLDTRPPHVEIVMTGRDVPKELIDRADLVTEMVPVKHYIDAGVKARRGIEY